MRATRTHICDAVQGARRWRPGPSRDCGNSERRKIAGEKQSCNKGKDEGEELELDHVPAAAKGWGR